MFPLLAPSPVFPVVFVVGTGFPATRPSAIKGTLHLLTADSFSTPHFGFLVEKSPGIWRDFNQEDIHEEMLWTVVTWEDREKSKEKERNHL